MSSDNTLAAEVRARQITMFAMFVGPGLHTTRVALAAASGIGDSTLRDWASGTTIPFHGVLRLRKFLPAEAINMLAEPGDVRLVDATCAASSWDGIAADAAGLTAEVCEARRDGRIDHVEEERLRRRARVLIAELQTVAEGG